MGKYDKLIEVLKKYAELRHIEELKENIRIEIFQRHTRLRRLLIEESKKNIKEENSQNRTIFEAVLTPNDLVRNGVKRKILFANIGNPDFESISFQFIMDSWFILHNRLPEVFIKDKGIFKETGKEIENLSDYKHLFHFNFDFSNENFFNTLVEFIKGNLGPWNPWDIVNKIYLLDKEYRYTILKHFEKTADYKRLPDAINKMYNNLLMYYNEIIRIEMDNSVKVNTGDLFWVFPKHGAIPIATGKIINVIKNKEVEK
jgi:hypothetical protein